MSILKRQRVLAAILFFIAFPANSAVIYDESVNGVLSNDVTATTLNFSVGTNSILGNAARGQTVSDYDNFQFILAPNTQLTGVSYSFSNIVKEGSISNLRTDFRISSLPTYATVASSVEFNIITSSGVMGVTPVDLFSTGLPILDGSTYRWNVSGSGFSGSAGTTDQAYWDYQLDFMVSAVGDDSGEIPVPAPLALLGLGLVALGFTSKHKA